MSTPFKMKGFSGFGNSPMKQKATLGQKAKSLAKTIMSEITHSNPNKSFWDTYTGNKASLKKSDAIENRKNKTVDGVTYDKSGNPTSKHYPYDNTTYKEKGE